MQKPLAQISPLLPPIPVEKADRSRIRYGGGIDHEARPNIGIGLRRAGRVTKGGSIAGIINFSKSGGIGPIDAGRISIGVLERATIIFQRWANPSTAAARWVRVGRLRRRKQDQQECQDSRLSSCHCFVFSQNTVADFYFLQLCQCCQ